MTSLDIARLKPDPVPAIHPVPEYLADPELTSRYEDAKTVLDVPWMGVVMMAFAHYRSFYDLLWRGARPLCLSAPFVTACRDLRALVERRVSEFSPPALGERLIATGYAPREIDAIRESIEVFSHGNYPYLLMATIARGLLEGHEPGGRGTAEAHTETKRLASRSPLVLMEPHHADAPTQKVYHDIRVTLGLPFVNTDYRALARWPSYFSRAWSDLSPNISSALYDAMAEDVHRRAVSTVASLPNPGELHSSALREAADRDASAEEVLAVVRLFQWLLPGLVINVAFFRHQLAKNRPT